jgi:hypothetical protein
MPRRAVLITAMLLMSVSALWAQRKSCPTLEANVADPRFKPGQVWTYRTRPGETSSTLTILQVDHLDKVGIVIHVRVDGLLMHNPAGDLVPFIEHMPFTRDAMLISVTRQVRRESSIPTLEGYERWRSDCGGVYSISVADAVAVADKTFNQP